MEKLKKIGSKIEPYVYLLPAFFFLTLFIFYPFIKNGWLSLNTVDQFRNVKAFAGAKNYLKVLADETFWQAVKNTFIYVFMCLLRCLPVLSLDICWRVLRASAAEHPLFMRCCLPCPSQRRTL